jgi:hydroxylaminobenzene mutase
MLTEMANAWWGTRNMLPIAAQQAGASGAAAWQEGFVTAAHVIGAVVMIAYWGTILLGLFGKPNTFRVDQEA